MGKRLYVGNLPYQCDEAQLRALFEQEGRQVEEVKIVTDRETGRPRGGGEPSDPAGPCRGRRPHRPRRAPAREPRSR